MKTAITSACVKNCTAWIAVCKKVAEDIIAHYDERTKTARRQAMVVVMSRAICVKLYEKITAFVQNGTPNDVLQGSIKIVMTSNASDPAEWQETQSG